jgi:hypothetical protein
VWAVASDAIKGGELDPSLTEDVVAAQTVGPVLYQRLFDGRDVSPADLERNVDAFLAAFAP